MPQQTEPGNFSWGEHNKYIFLEQEFNRQATHAHTHGHVHCVCLCYCHRSQ